jgi:hypothetical protein
MTTPANELAGIAIFSSMKGSEGGVHHNFFVSLTLSNWGELPGTAKFI